MNTLSPRVLIVAPFTHQNGHFVMPRERQLAWERDIAAMAQRFTWSETARQLMAELGLVP